MTITFTDKALKGYRKLPLSIKKKADKQFKFVINNMYYPSLNTKKMEGVNLWEGRIDRAYRFTFEKHKDEIILRTVGPHDEGLGKK